MCQYSKSKNRDKLTTSLATCIPEQCLWSQSALPFQYQKPQAPRCSTPPQLWRSPSAHIRLHSFIHYSAREILNRVCVCVCVSETGMMQANMAWGVLTSTMQTEVGICLAYTHTHTHIHGRTETYTDRNGACQRRRGDASTSTTRTDVGTCLMLPACSLPAKNKSLAHDAWPESSVMPCKRDTYHIRDAKKMFLKYKIMTQMLGLLNLLLCPVRETLIT